MSNEAILPVDEWAREIEDRLKRPDISHITDPFLDKNEWPSIFGNWKDLKDFEVSFLPETKKWQFVAYMMRWFDLKLPQYLQKFQEKENLVKVWSYYRGVNEQFRAENGKCFIEHLLGTSCFLIFAMVIIKYDGCLMQKLRGSADESPNSNDRRKEFNNLYYLIQNEEAIGIKRYMLNMNYQIPWIVVKAVYENYSNLNVDLGIPILKLALSCFDKLSPTVHKSKEEFVQDGRQIPIPDDGFKHLLHIFHWSRSPEEKFEAENMKSQALSVMDGFSIPSATDLQLSETFFKEHPDGSIAVAYSEWKLFGLMKLAPWHTSEYSIELYESILKFERGYELCGLPFTAYVACIVCLLQTKADVRLLREKRIIPSTRNDDEDVLSYVKEFKKILHDSAPMSKDLSKLSKDVTARCNRKCPRYYGEFKSHYCANPWITISVIAGILLFVLTIIQTVYSVLSYKNQ